MKLNITALKKEINLRCILALCLLTSGMYNEAEICGLLGHGFPTSYSCETKLWALYGTFVCSLAFLLFFIPGQ